MALVMIQCRVEIRTYHLSRDTQSRGLHKVAGYTTNWYKKLMSLLYFRRPSSSSVHLMKVKQNNNKNEVDQEVVENASKFVQVEINTGCFPSKSL